MDACLEIYDGPSENFDFGPRQGKQGSRERTVPAGLVGVVDIAAAHRDSRALIANGVAKPSIVETSVREFGEIMKSQPVSAYLTSDGLAAGIICSREWKYRNWDVYCRFAKIFFGIAHGDICDRYEKQFKSAAKLHGKG